MFQQNFASNFPLCLMIHKYLVLRHSAKLNVWTISVI